MKVILLQDVEKLGKKYEVKNVKSGYARNLLIPNNLAKPATKEVLKWIETQKEIEGKQAEEELKEVQDIVSKIDGFELTVPVKIGEEGQLFESINIQKISEKMKEAGFEIEKNQINLEKPIKELGEFPIKISFEHNLEAEVRIIITEEKS